MVNLLPPNLIRECQSDYRRRRWQITAVLLTSLIAVDLVAIASLMFIAWTRGQTARGEADKLADQTETATFNQLDATRERAESELNTLSGLAEVGTAPAPVLRALVNHQSTGVRLTKIGYEPLADSKARLELGGSAGTRQQLLSFLDTLRTDPAISELNSPISNLIKSTSINFTLTLKIKLPPKT